MSLFSAFTYTIARFHDYAQNESYRPSLLPRMATAFGCGFSAVCKYYASMRPFCCVVGSVAALMGILPVVAAGRLCVVRSGKVMPVVRYYYYCQSTSRVIDNLPALVPVELNARNALIARDLAFALETYICTWWLADCARRCCC